MMKTMKKNKGVAMIICLIAILFIAVLASSLLYMALLNNQMKTMRRYSTDNFYTAEYALDDMLSQLKQYSSIQTNPRDDLASFLNSSGDKSTLDTAAVQGLIGVQDYMKPVFEDGGSITVDSIYSSGSYVEDGNSIWLKGVRITVQTNEKNGSLKSTVVTDIELRFPGTATGKGKLNDFSILADSPIYITSSSQYFCGDLYCRKNNNTTIGKDNAFRVGGKAVVNVLSNFAFFDGDLKVDETGIMYLSGTTYVNGNIYVDSSASLNVGGNLYVKGKINGTVRKGPGAKVFENGAGGVNWSFYTDNYSDGLACKLLSDSVCIHIDSTSSPAGYGYSGTRNIAKLTQEDFLSLVTNDEYTSSRGKLTSTTVNSRKISAIYVTNDVNHNYENTLIISAVPLDNFHGTVKNCTMVNINHSSKGLIYIGNPQQWANAWGTMDDEAYDVAKNLMFCAESSKDIYSSTMTFGDPNNASSGLSMDDLVHEDGMATDTYKLGSFTVKQFNGTDGGNEAPYYYNAESGKQRQNFFPYRNLLRDDIDIKLGEFMYGAAGSTDPDATTQPKVYLYNWSKE